MNIALIALLALSQLSSGNNHSNEDLLWLTLTVFCEARSEAAQGQIAVASVVMNRVDSQGWGDDIESVVRQRRQFEGVPSGNVYLLAFSASLREPVAWKLAQDAVVDALKWRYYYKLIYPWDHYYAPLVRLQRGLPAAPGWAAGMRKKAVGEHVFCKTI